MLRYLFVLSGLLSWWAFCWMAASSYTEEQARSALSWKKQEAQRIASDLEIGFNRIVAVRQGMPRHMAGEPQVVDILQRVGQVAGPSPLGYEERKRRWTSDPVLADLDRGLRQAALQFGLDNVWILNAAGECIAAANAHTPESPVGTSYADRGYMAVARRGESTHVINLGRVWRVPRITFIEPVMVKGRFAGVMAAGANLDSFRNWAKTTHSIFADENGVIMLAFDPALVLRALPGAAVANLDERTRMLLYGQKDIPEIALMPWENGRFPDVFGLPGDGEPYVVAGGSGGGLAISVLQAVPEVAQYAARRGALFAAGGIVGSLLGLLALAGAGYLRALSWREAEFRRLAELSPDHVVRYDAEGHVRYFNNRLAQLLDLPRANVLGKRIDQFDPDGRFSALELARRRIMAGAPSEDVEIRLPTEDGGFMVHLVHVVPEVDISGRRHGTVAFGRDISVVKRLEETASEKYRQQLFAAQRIAHVGSWELDVATGHIAWSEEVFRIFECDPRQFRMSLSGVLSFVHPEDRERVEHSYAQALADRMAWSIEHRLRMPDGRTKHVRVLAETAFDGEGRPVRSFGTVQDITAECEAAQELAEAHLRLGELMRHQEDMREEERKRASYDLHEELGQVLSGLRMRVSALGIEFREEAYRPLLAKLPAMVSLLDLALDRLRRTVSALRPPVLASGIVAALEWQLREFETATSTRCRLESSEDLVLPEASATAVFRIVEAALSNVAQHAGATRVDVSIVRAGADWQVRISDDGRGFDPTSIPGKSFGLFIMRERAQRLGGTMRIEAVPGKGTVVEIRIPVAPEAENS
jgi:PAS domain S-box-containing protein